MRVKIKGKKLGNFEKEVRTRVIAGVSSFLARQRCGGL
jgi:hypothetical protein